MKYTLSSNVLAGQMIKTLNGWRKVISVGETGVTVKGAVILFGETIYGWKIK